MLSLEQEKWASYVNYSLLSCARMKQNTEQKPSSSSLEQDSVEKKVEKLFEEAEQTGVFKNLIRTTHIKFLNDNLYKLPPNYLCLDASRTWICYWICHSLRLLHCDIPEYVQEQIIDFLKRCQASSGGFGGGPGLTPHLAATYAAVMALCCLKSEKAMQIIRRDDLQKFILAVKDVSGSFHLEECGEIDIRGVYCAVAVACILNLDMGVLFENTAEWVAMCQTYEGGFAGYPGMEAHGGYTYCGVASLHLLNKSHLCHLEDCLRWTIQRQMPYEGGFQGRPNKLVDSCYSFWLAATIGILYVSMEANVGNPQPATGTKGHLYDNKALQEYILQCCQNTGGGFVDKPGKSRDLYHTCYSLSGLSVAQYFLSKEEPDTVGDSRVNRVEMLHALLNLEMECFKWVRGYYGIGTAE